MSEPAESAQHPHLPPARQLVLLPPMSVHTGPGPGPSSVPLPPASPSALSQNGAHRARVPPLNLPQRSPDSHKPLLPPPSQNMIGSHLQSSPLRSLPLPAPMSIRNHSGLPPPSSLRLNRPLPHRRHHTCSQIEYTSQPAPPYRASPVGAGLPGYPEPQYPPGSAPYDSSRHPHAHSQPSHLPRSSAIIQLPSSSAHAPQSSVAGSSVADHPLSDDYRLPGSTGKRDSVSDDSSDKGTSKKKKKTQRFFCTKFPPCDLSFTRSEHLARHIRKHTGEKPFKCHCGRFFSRLDNLRQHAQTVHVNQDIPQDSLAAYVSRTRTRNSGSGIRSRASTLTSSSIGGTSHSRSVSTSSITSTGSVLSNGYPLENRMSALGLVEGGIGGIAGLRPTSAHKPVHPHGRAVSVNELPSFQFPPRPPAVQQPHSSHSSHSGFQFPPPPQEHTLSRPVINEHRHDRGISTGHLPAFQFPAYNPAPPPMASQAPAPTMSVPPLQHPTSVDKGPVDAKPLPGIEALKRAAFERRVYHNPPPPPPETLLRPMHHQAPPSGHDNGRLAVLLE